MGEVKFTTVKTNVTAHFPDCTEVKSNTVLVPDLTGDGVPDFVTIYASMGEEGTCNTYTHRLHLHKGKFGPLKDKGKLIKSKRSTLIFSKYFKKCLKRRCDGISNFRNFQVADYNHDGRMDISFWEFTGNDCLYEKVLLLNKSK